MEEPVTNYWKIRLADLKEALKENNFEVFLADSTAEAKEIVQGKIIPDTGARTISWGGSMTFRATGLYEAIKDNPEFEVLDVFDKDMTPQKTLELRRRSLIVDLFITGTNAITKSGMLVNLDMYGNRVAGITFGPKYVVVLVGRNKIVHDLEDAFLRIKNYVAPINAMRLDKKVPCVKTSFCDECKSSDRICNTWTVTEKSFPKGRIKVVLINQDLGL